jgi:hypothetical protein
MSSLKMFVSHTSQYSHLARSLRMSMQALQPQTVLDIRIHEDMPGGTDWRKWIEENTRTANAFVLLYPHDSMDMSWPNYEVARFYDRENDCESKIVWIRNPDVKKMPAVFEPYQAYNATQADLLRFFREVFVKGLLTDGEPLNPEIGIVSNDYYQLAVKAAQELVEQFAEASIAPEYHTRRIVISPTYDSKRNFAPDRSDVEGNSEGLRMIGMSSCTDLTWSTVRATLGETVQWPAELEREMSSFVAGKLPPALSPFSLDDEIYIPVIAKCETVRALLHRISVIFVEAEVEKLRPMLDWKMPDAMPDQVATLIRLVRLMLRVRYDILEPRYQEARFSAPSSERCAELANAVLADYAGVRLESARIGAKGMEAFYMVFDASLKPLLDDAGDEYVTAIKALKEYARSLRAPHAAEHDEAGGLAASLKKLLENNAHWLEIAGKQFGVLVSRWQ